MSVALSHCGGLRDADGPANQLPAGWHVTSVSQSGTIGIYQNRVFVALINLNAENAYRVVITARK